MCRNISALFSSQFKKILSYPILQNSPKILLFFILTKILLYPILWIPPPFTSYTPIYYHLFTSYTPISYNFLHLTHLFSTTFYILHTYTLPPFTSYTPIPYHFLPKFLEYCLNLILIQNHQNSVQITTQTDPSCLYDSWLKVKNTNQKKQRVPRFAFMTKSEVDHLEDGYRWSKYGQKAAKNSPYPRNIDKYHCSSASCNVKKRVERSYGDPSIVVTRDAHFQPKPLKSPNPNRF
ncbi:hypothetical protein UlMin_029996 [Ulmus minor]